MRQVIDGLILAVAGLFLTACANASTTAINAGAPHAAGAVAAPPDTKASKPGAANFVSVKVMLGGGCNAGSEVDTHAPGGFWKSDNMAKAVDAGCAGKGLYLLAQPEVVTTLGKDPAMRLLLVNQTGDLLAFTASDSRLSIVQEARDSNGNWKPIEYLPRSDCGNSYHRVFLQSHYFWEFNVPRYQGTQKTQLRFTLALDDKTLIHSNVFEGSVNVEQFSVKQGHTPTDIMDPYRE